MNLIIREANSNDVDNILLLYKQVDDLHCCVLPKIFKESKEIIRTRDFFEQIFEDESASLLVAECKSQLVGFVEAYIRETNHPALKPRRYGHVSDIVVDYHYRRKGIGHRLMSQTHQWILSKGITDVELGVFSFNKEASSFYSKLGYKNKLCIMNLLLKETECAGDEPFHPTQ